MQYLLRKSFSTSFKKPRVFQSRTDTQQDEYKRQREDLNERSQEEFKPRRKEDDDVHSARLTEALKTFAQTNDEPVSKFHKYDFYDKKILKQLPMSDLNITNIHNDEDIGICSKLEHNLDFISRNHGIYHFDEIAKLIDNVEDREFLRNIYPQDQLKLDRFDIYMPPSKDPQLLELARKDKMKFIMSTSTISNFLCQIFYAVSGFRSPFFEDLFIDENEPFKYMISQRKPISNFVYRKKNEEDGTEIYALDGDNGFFRYSNILMNVGKIVERQLTFKRKDFVERFTSEELPEDYPPLVDHHRYMKLNNEILLRSQIDCYSHTVDGKPFVFEIKSRAVCPIRYDFPNCMDYVDYEINQYKGLYESYEREYYDLIRGAFLKWSFQLRIGRMEGAFVAYHNIRQIQGFEYVSLKEIENRIYGSAEYSQAIFVVSSKLLTTILNELFDDHLKKEQWETLKIGVYASSQYKKLILFVELFKSSGDVKKYRQVDPSEELIDEYDYFEKIQPLENKVLKFEVLLNVQVNGTDQVGQAIPFRKGDSLNITYLLNPLGDAGYIDYMNFLHDCYKFEEINLELNYAGAWVKNSQF